MINRILDRLDDAIDTEGFGLSAQARQAIRHIIEQDLGEALLSHATDFEE